MSPIEFSILLRKFDSFALEFEKLFRAYSELNKCRCYINAYQIDAFAEHSHLINGLLYRIPHGLRLS